MPTSVPPSHHRTDMRSHAAAILGPGAPALTFCAPPRSRPAWDPDPRWDLLLLCLAGYVLTAVGRIHQLVPVLGLLRPAILTGVLAITLYLIDRTPERRSRLLPLPTVRLLAMFLLWMTLSVPGALVVGNSFDLVFNGFLKTFLMFVVLVGSVRALRDVERLAVVYLLAATVYAVVVLVEFDLGSGDGWRLDNLYYYDANDFAVLALTAMPFGLYFLQTSRRTFSRTLAAGALAILAVAFVRTGSRGGFVALLAVIGFIVFRYSAIPLRRRLGATALVTLVVVGTASNEYWAQMSTILSDADYNHTAESGRMQIWRRGVDYMFQHPVFGVGPNNFASAEGMLSPHADRGQLGIGVRWNAAHNSFVQVGAELGVPGLVLFIAIIASAFVALGRSAGRRRRSAPDARQGQLAQVITASLIAFVVGALFLSLAYTEMLYVLVALAVSLQKVSLRR